jgi:hypothetical protein
MKGEEKNTVRKKLVSHHTQKKKREIKQQSASEARRRCQWNADHPGHAKEENG